MPDEPLEEICTEHQPASEWYVPENEEGGDIQLSALTLFHEVHEKKRLMRAVRPRRSGNLYKLKQPRSSVSEKSKTADIKDEATRRVFDELSNKWRTETRHISSISKKSIHPAYQNIIGMGQAAIPFILRELQERGGHWFWALHAITREDPAQEGDDFDAAVEAWLNWGKSRGHIGTS